MFNRRFGNGAATLGVVVVASIGLVAGASAAPIESLFMSLGATPMFDADAGAQGEWVVPAASAFNGTALDTAAGIFNIADQNFLSPAGSVTWQGNPLVSDNSVGTLAAATFGPGGTFALYGEVYKNFVLQPNPGNLPLITGTISGFSVEEQQNAPNFMDLVVGNTPILTPTGGLLVDGTLAEMPTGYYLSFSGAEVMENGGDLEDFQFDVQTVDVVLFTLVAVPEPGSLVLLAGLAVFAMRRR